MGQGRNKKEIKDFLDSMKTKAQHTQTNGTLEIIVKRKAHSIKFLHKEVRQISH